MIDYNSITNIKLCGCAPKQIVLFNIPVKNADLLNIEFYDNCSDKYDINTLEYGYSLDSVCWSCYVKYDDLLRNTVNLNQDFYLRVKIPGTITKIILCCKEYTDYSVQLDSAFNYSYCSMDNANMYNPYANMSCAIDLNRNMSDLVVCMFGIPIYYFKLKPNQGSKDLTFKEYTLMDVEPPKQIKLVVQDGQMPSSKPEFNEFGLDWQTDWETEIGKTMFTTAFGPTAQPMEGDFIYIPMMKRMWQVSGAYEEKKEAFMWNATTFKVSLIKYEEKGSVQLGELDDLVNSFVKNTYEELFGDDEDTAGTGEESTEAPKYAADNLLPVFKSDATRKFITNTGVIISDTSTYFKGTVISDAWYTFNMLVDKKQIIYQKQYCGDNITISFIINPLITMAGESYEGTLLSLGHIKINIKQHQDKTTIYVNKDENLSITIPSGNTYFIFIRWSKDLYIAEISAILYTYNQNIPLYKLQNHHYFYDVDNKLTVSQKWTPEYTVEEPTDIILNNFYGNITNIKVFEMYNDNISEILQQYPTNNYLLLNDTARKLVGLDGVQLR